MGADSRSSVLMLTSTLPRWQGDAEPRFVLDLAHSLESDFHIELIAPHTPGAQRSEYLEGVPVTRYRYWWPRWQAIAYDGGMTQRLRANPLRLVQLPFFFIALIITIARRLRRQPAVSLIHAHWLIPQGLAAVIARRLSGVPVPILCTSHGGDLHGLRGPLLTRIKRWILESCDDFTVVSHAMVDVAQRISVDSKPHVIPMGTDLRERFTPPETPRTPLLNRLIFVGRLVPKKGVEFLLRAMARIRKYHPDITLDIVGHGPLSNDLHELAARLRLTKQVNFVGPVPHERLAEYYQAAGIAVFPFVEAADGDQEGFGLVMVEAMGCGCAVIASDLPAVRDVIQSGANGTLPPPGQPEALANAIVAAIENPLKTSAMAEQARARAIEKFDWQSVGDRFKAVYDSLIEHRSPSAP